MNKLKILILLCISSILFVFAFGCTSSSMGTTTHSFFVSHENIVLEVGDSVTITARYGEEEVGFLSTDTAVVQVDESGVVTAKQLGEAYIEISAGGLQRSCKVVVVSVDYTVTLNKVGEVKVYLGARLNLLATTYKDGTEYDGAVEWKVDKQTASLIVDGKSAIFYSNAKGVYKVTVRSNKGATTQLLINVIDVSELN